MKYFFKAWPKLEGLIFKASHIVLMLDYDGTLTSIVEKPELAALPEETRALLKNISLLPNCTLCIVSGRELKDIKNMVKIENLIYIGNHGLEASGKGIEYVNPDAVKTSEIIKRIHQELLEELGDVPGVLLEYKRLTEVLHYRMVSESGFQEVRGGFNRITEPYLKKSIIKIAENKKTLEVLPNVGWDKGKIVQYIISSTNMKHNLLPIYVGDDATDEDAFKVVRSCGIAILVSEHPASPHAQYYVRDVNEVIKFLGMLYSLEKRR